MNTLEDKNYYEILEIPTTASPSEVQRGYMRAKSAYSQDSLAMYSLISKEECEKVLNLIDEAYEIISDPSKRKAYDQAKGISETYSEHNHFYSSREKSNIDQSIEKSINNPKSNNSIGITKIVAKNKYALEYEKNSEFEKEIEQMTDFTGEVLKKIREYKQVDIPRMSEMTKVSKSYLINIEDEDLENLPALVYVRGFVYQYAKCLKLNPELVATSYMYRLRTIQSEN